MSNKIQLITGYYYQIFERNKKGKKPLIVKNDLESYHDGEYVNLKKLLKDFYDEYIVEKVDDIEDRVLQLSQSHLIENSEFIQFDFKSKTGRYGYSREMVDVKSSEWIPIDENKAIIFPYYVYFFIKENFALNVCIFHRFGRGGTKTVLMKKLNSFLKDKGLILHTRAIVNDEYIESLSHGKPVKLRYTKYSVQPISTDIADNVRGRNIDKQSVEMTLTINLKNSKMKNKFGIDVSDYKNPSIMFEDLPDDFRDTDNIKTKLDMVVNGRQKVWDIDGRTVYDFEVTKDLQYSKGNHPTYESINSVMLSFYRKFLDGARINDKDIN